MTHADDHLGAATIVLAGLEADRSKARALVEWLQAEDEPSTDSQALAEEVEWYLIARLATQRAVCLGGSLPMLLDDALAALEQDQLIHVLDRLERMADAVQVIVVTDDPRASAWAVDAGLDRAAAVQPQPLVPSPNPRQQHPERPPNITSPVRDLEVQWPSSPKPPSGSSQGSGATSLPSHRVTWMSMAGG